MSNEINPSNYYISAGDCTGIISYNQETTPLAFEFTNLNNTVGKLWFVDGVLHFDGDADESAKQFYDTFQRLIDSRYAEVCKELEALKAELERENKRLAEALANANEQAERFERLWYLRGDEIERLQDEATDAREQQPVAYRAWFDKDNGARWLFTLWPEEERLDVDWEPLFTAPPQETIMQHQIEDLRREVLAYSITCENAEMFDYKREALAWSITCENLEAGYV